MAGSAAKVGLSGLPNLGHANIIPRRKNHIEMIARNIEHIRAVGAWYGTVDGNQPGGVNAD